MCLDMLLQVLWPLESLSAEVAFVRLERHMDSHVRGDVIALHGGCAACAPRACEVQVVSRLATDMALTDMVLDRVLVCIQSVKWRFDIHKVSRVMRFAHHSRATGK